VESIVDAILGQIGGLLDVAGADTSGGISLTASQGGKSWNSSTRVGIIEIR
jgi:hypothetical protein